MTDPETTGYVLEKLTKAMNSLVDNRSLEDRLRAAWNAELQYIRDRRAPGEPGARLQATLDRLREWATADSARPVEELTAAAREIASLYGEVSGDYGRM